MLHVQSTIYLVVLLHVHGKKFSFIITSLTLIKTALNNVLLPTLFIVVSNIEQYCWAWIDPQSGVSMLNNTVELESRVTILDNTVELESRITLDNIVDNYQKWKQQNIFNTVFVYRKYNFLLCTGLKLKSRLVLVTDLASNTSTATVHWSSFSQSNGRTYPIDQSNCLKIGKR